MQKVAYPQSGVDEDRLDEERVMTVDGTQRFVVNARALLAQQTGQVLHFAGCSSKRADNR